MRRVADYCVEEAQKAQNKVNGVYTPQLDGLRNEIKRLQDAGVDPNRYVVEFEGQFVPITYKASIVMRRYNNELSHVLKKAEGCVKNIAPVQAATDLTVLYLTSGLSMVLPERMTHIDTGQIIHGNKPFGGDGAFIPKMRDDMLDALNIGGDVRTVIVDPLKALRGLFRM